MRRGRLIALVLLGSLVLSLSSAAVAFGCAQLGPATVGSDCPSASPTPQPQQPNPSADGAAQQFMALTNQERTSRGLGSLADNAQLETISLGHAFDMAQAGQIYHNPDLYSDELRAALGNPYVIGENVGRGDSVQDIHDAFMASQAHRDNILRSDFTSAGMAVVSADGSLWVVEMFMSPPRAPSGGSIRERSGMPASRHAAPATGSAAAAAWEWLSLGGSSDDVTIDDGNATVLGATSSEPSSTSEEAVTGVAACLMALALIVVRRRRRRARAAGAPAA